VLAAGSLEEIYHMTRLENIPESGYCTSIQVSGILQVLVFLAFLSWPI
jgi:hypothetical protein